MTTTDAPIDVPGDGPGNGSGARSPQDPGAPTATGGGARSGATPTALPLEQVLTTPILAGAQVLAGAAGLGRTVTRLNVMEVPDVLAFVKPDEFLLTTGYPLRERPDELPRLVADLDARGLAGLGVKLGRYLDELPAAVLEAADARGFPIVQLPDVAFDDVLNDVLGAMLDRQAQQLARAERVHRAFLQVVLRGEGVDAIAADLAELLDMPAAVVGLDGTVLASARCDELDPPPRERLVVAQDARHVRIDGREQRPCVAVPIVAGPRQHGHVVAVPRDGRRTDDLLALESAATVAALALTQRMELQAVESKYQSDLVHDLLRRVDDPDDVLRRAAGFGWDLDRRLIALVVRLDDRPGVERPAAVRGRPPLASTIRGAVLARDPAAAVVRFSAEVVVLTAAFEAPAEATAEDGRAEARAFVADLVARAGKAAGGTVSAGLSRPVEDVRDVARAYEQASQAVALGREIAGRGAVTHFDDLGAYRLLALVEDREELYAFATEVLGELATETEAALDLRTTLQALLDTGGNVAEAARRLHFHYNTLRYRIEKLESLLGPFMTDARRRLDVQLALLVLRLRDQR
ncbi:PucR family transcriptional regulator [Egicoccus halophilus]|uniref:CdaR family transcriptional regulator n=1 Tax=Egicoccus halophilus TaxID=1670830 RepID=A0A8J3AD11_9ACTN|nr:PucR family transcriptional regulator [Egicoccus halophilus]GGI04234.1 CdaR family transcriptional regulator [Egicoccus halophilus]